MTLYEIKSKRRKFLKKILLKYDQTSMFNISLEWRINTFCPFLRKMEVAPKWVFFLKEVFLVTKINRQILKWKFLWEFLFWSFLSVKNNCHFESFYGIFSRLKNKYQLRVFIGSFLSVKNNYLSNSTLKKEDIFWKKVWKKTTRYNWKA